MARGNKYTCKTCGTSYEYCPKCAVTRPNYDAEKFCSKAHDDVFAILSKHGCNLITAEETLAELKAYNIDEIKFTKEIAAHIKRIKSEAKASSKVAEPVAAEQSTKKQ